MNAAVSRTARSLASRAPVRERLITMLFLTALLHAIVILGLTFGTSADGDTTPGMEILLVTEDLPESTDNAAAAYLAQRRQQGAGNTRTLPTSTVATTSPPQEPQESQRGSAEQQATPLLSTTGRSPLIRYLGTIEVAAARPPRPAVSSERPSSGRGEGTELVLRGDARTGRWLAPDTQATTLAPYLDSWRRKVERLGTLNYPNAARATRQASSPVIEVAIRSDGRLQEARLQRSSGQPALDQAALSILKLASPFEPFPPEMAAEYRILRFAYQWEFVAGRTSIGNVTTGTDGAAGP